MSGSEYVTRETLQQNIEIEKECFKIMKDMIATNNKALVANLLDMSRKIIVSTKDLKRLIKIAVGDENKIKIETDIEQKTCICCHHKVNIHPYENIIRISIDGEDFEDAQPDLYEYLQSYCNISLDKTYKENVIHIEKEDQQ